MNCTKRYSNALRCLSTVVDPFDGKSEFLGEPDPFWLYELCHDHAVRAGKPFNTRGNDEARHLVALPTRSDLQIAMESQMAMGTGGHPGNVG